MHFSTIASSVLLVVSGVTAAPNLVVRDIAAEVALYTGRGCTGDGVRFGTAFPPDDGSCFVIPQNQGIANSGMIDTPIPAGCTLTFWANPTCNSTNFVPVSTQNQCFTLGDAGPLRSVRSSGPC